MVRECGREEWAKFRRYHYLSNDISSAAKCFGLYDEQKIVGFIGVLHQPHSVTKNIKRCSRLVILPDYQGIGLGTKFLNLVAESYASKGYVFTIVTTAKNMIMALNRSDKWRMIHYGANSCTSNKSAIDYGRKTIRSNCKCASFKFRHDAVNASPCGSPSGDV